MILSRILILATVFVFGNATPILKGRNAGKVEKHQDKTIVINSGQFPYAVHITRETIKKSKINPKNIAIEIGYCGGIIIKEDVILTAAHCFGDTTDRVYKIWAWAGIVDTAKEKGMGQKIAVKHYKRHDKYIGGYQYGIFHPNDIGIAWLEKKFKTDEKYVKLATLPQENFNVENKRGFMIGWGVTTCGETSSMLQKATMRAMSQEKCEGYYNPMIITDRVICILSDQKESINAQGDSGGPFVVQGTAVGLSSFATVTTVKKKDGTKTESCSPKKPGVYTNISKYLDWINKQLKDGPPNKIIKSKL